MSARGEPLVATVAQVALVGVVCFALTALLAAPRLARSAPSATVGPRHDLGAAVLTPLAMEPPSEAPSLAPAPSPAPRTPTPHDPLRILVVGDSIATDLGHALAEVAAASGTARVVVDTRPASGLARPDYFDWPSQLAADIRRHDPEVVVVMLGGNDAQPFLSDGVPLQVGTPEWEKAYAARVAGLMEIARGRGRRALWVGLPIMRDAVFSELMAGLDRIYREQASSRDVAYVDSWPLFIDAKGRYAAYLPDASGALAAMRQPDGIHLSLAGANRLAGALYARIAPGQ